MAGHASNPGWTGLHPLVAEVASQQFATLRRIHVVFLLLLVVLAAVVIWLSPPFERASLGLPPGPGEYLLLLAGLLVALVVIPLLRLRLLDTGRVARAGERQLAGWGLPRGVPAPLGRQAVYLSRYTAGSVMSWALAVSLALYGLVARLLGSGALLAALLLATAAFLLVWLGPDRKRIARGLGRLGTLTPEGNDVNMQSLSGER
ncbi:MAG: hypothetical protein DRI34_02715 [Deltaproteobacteria bacterium]|nr:MAG: hypothetical protein DRI34_02715 [Deltaproteobacteria bacterium]